MHGHLHEFFSRCRVFEVARFEASVERIALLKECFSIPGQHANVIIYHKMSPQTQSHASRGSKIVSDSRGD
jgi:hypothetical protein